MHLFRRPESKRAQAAATPDPVTLAQPEDTSPQPDTSPLTTTGEDMFCVDVEGLRRKFANRSKRFLLYELYQNAVDEEVTQVNIEFRPIEGEPWCRIVVEDDSPEGFRDLAHAYTLFADSSKLGNPEQRGIWNLGEKFVLAFCREATICSTRGTVIFRDGRRYLSDTSRDRGTRFEAIIQIDAKEYEDCCIGMDRLVTPAGIQVTFNGRRLLAPPVVREVEVFLPTTIGDEFGAIRKTIRKTAVRLYEPVVGEKGWIYELGIPVVQSGDKWHYDVQQRVPLNMQRDNVTPAYLQGLRVAVLNAMHNKVEESDVNQDWVRAATNDKRCTPEATGRALDLRYGQKRVAYDPSDVEANNRAVAAGYRVVHGGNMSKTEWDNAKSANLIKPAGKVTPSDKNDLDEDDSLQLKETDFTPGIKLVVEYAERIAPALVGHPVKVEVCCDPRSSTLACYGPQAPLTLNLGRLGHRFFDNRSKQGLQRINELLIHEFGHEWAFDHLSRDYYDALCKVGGRLAQLAVEHPEYLRGMTEEASAPSAASDTEMF